MWSCRHTESMSATQFRTRESSNLTINTVDKMLHMLPSHMSFVQDADKFNFLSLTELKAIFTISFSKAKNMFLQPASKDSKNNERGLVSVALALLGWNFLDSSNCIKYHFWKQEYQGSLCIPLLALHTWLHSGMHTVNSTINHPCKAANISTFYQEKERMTTLPPMLLFQGIILRKKT